MSTENEQQPTEQAEAKAGSGSSPSACSAKAQADQLRQKVKDAANLIARKAMNLPENVNVPIIDGMIDALVACAVLEAYSKLAADLRLPNNKIDR